MEELPIDTGVSHKLLYRRSKETNFYIFIDIGCRDRYRISSQIILGTRECCIAPFSWNVRSMLGVEPYTSSFGCVVF